MPNIAAKKNHTWYSRSLLQILTRDISNTRRYITQCKATVSNFCKNSIF